MIVLSPLTCPFTVIDQTQYAQVLQSHYGFLEVEELIQSLIQCQLIGWLVIPSVSLEKSRSLPRRPVSRAI